MGKTYRIPHLPDVVLYHIFGFLDYQQLCKAESVCRRWQSTVMSLMRRHIQEITIERQFGISTPSVSHLMAFRRLAISCPLEKFDFLTGVLRRSHSSLFRMTIDVKILANLAQIAVNKDEGGKYFPNVEDLWILIIDCDDVITNRFLRIENQLFNKITNLTIQVHIVMNFYNNVGKVCKALTDRHKNANIQFEFHAPFSSMVMIFQLFFINRFFLHHFTASVPSCMNIFEVFGQLFELHSFHASRIKIICTEFNLPTFRLDRLYTVAKERDIRTNNLVVRDWTILVNVTMPIIAYPLDTLRISSCTIESVDDLIESLRVTMEEEFSIPTSSTEKRNATVIDKDTVKLSQQKRVNETTKKANRILYLKKLELAGQCTLCGLQFLQSEAHLELEKRLKVAIPEVEVDCKEIYYCW
ncbi:F-box domain protein [Dictyocaulus viviparus]|uniref:F-box domain protein n=1 Tax=Dictyocaulus viviparus TaxID=29172 RepID=A0A0D8XRQ7_DICVI|nr:F-box domain protein [Dictyocaulus viviparus]